MFYVLFLEIQKNKLHRKICIYIHSILCISIGFRRNQDTQLTMIQINKKSVLESRYVEEDHYWAIPCYLTPGNSRVQINTLYHEIHLFFLSGGDTTIMQQLD